MENLFKLHIKSILALLLILLAAQLGFAGEPILASASIPPEQSEDYSQNKPLLLAKKTVLNSFDPLFSQVTLELGENQQRYLDDPAAYQRFVNRLVKPLWDSKSTARALIGRQRFDLLNLADKVALEDAVDNTLRRYAFEGLERYSGQRFRVVDVVVNQRAGMGWVQVLMESSLIPDIHFDVLIKQSEAGRWKAVDVRFKGITYVAVKKHKFRKTIDEKGVKTLIAELQIKNREYFSDICAKAEIVGVPPCPVQVK